MMDSPARKSISQTRSRGGEGAEAAAGSGADTALAGLRAGSVTLAIIPLSGPAVKPRFWGFGRGAFFAKVTALAGRRAGSVTLAIIPLSGPAVKPVFWVLCRGPFCARITAMPRKTGLTA